MIDNWKGGGGYRFEIMEGGGGGGGGRSFRDDWAEWTWRGRSLFLVIMLFLVLGAVGIVYLIVGSEQRRMQRETEHKAQVEACQKAAPTPYEYFKCK